MQKLSTNIYYRFCIENNGGKTSKLVNKNFVISQYKNVVKLRLFLKIPPIRVLKC